jgi:hypothetical protein
MERHGDRDVVIWPIALVEMMRTLLLDAFIYAIPPDRYGISAGRLLALTTELEALIAGSPDNWVIAEVPATLLAELREVRLAAQILLDGPAGGEGLW